MSSRNGNRAKVVRLLQQGLPQRVVADRLGLARGTVAAYRHWAREQGVKIPPRKKGRPKAIVSCLPAAVRHWLAAQLPEDTTLEEMIAAIVVDAYHEEMGK